MKRRTVLRLATGLAAAPFVAGLPAFGAMAQEIDFDAIYNDPEAPTGGNPKGDVPLVAFLDYNCPYCKKSAPDLERAVREDGKVRLVYKDWPILSKASVLGARLALTANYQGKYEAVHKALMEIPGGRASEDDMIKAVQKSGVDLNRLQADLDGKAEAVMAILRRNLAQADSLMLQGTPTYLVGPIRASTLDYAGFKTAIAEARRIQAQ